MSDITTGLATAAVKGLEDLVVNKVIGQETIEAIGRMAEKVEKVVDSYEAKGKVASLAGSGKKINQYGDAKNAYRKEVVYGMLRDIFKAGFNVPLQTVEPLIRLLGDKVNEPSIKLVLDLVTIMNTHLLPEHKDT